MHYKTEILELSSRLGNKISTAEVLRTFSNVIQYITHVFNDCTTCLNK